MKKLLCLIAAIHLLSIALTAQVFCTSFGSSGTERGYSIKQTFDHGFVICGSSGNDAYIIKLDSLQNVQWQKTYGGTGIEVAYSIVQTYDSGYAFTGYTTSFGIGNRDVYVVRTDKLGNIVWTRTCGGVQADGAFSIDETSDSGFVVGGYTGSFGVWPTENYIVKLSKTGIVQFKSTVGGSHQDYGYCAIQTANGGYAMVGQWANNTNGREMYISTFTAAGTLLWTHTVGDHANAPDVAYSVVQTADGGLVMAGYSQSWGAGAGDLYITKFDGNGNYLWNRTIGGPMAECTTVVSLTDPKPVSMALTSDGGFILASSTMSFGVLGGQDAYIVKLDSVGTVQWTRTIGGGGSDEAFSIVQTSNGGYALTGRTTSFGIGNDDIFFAVLDSLGNDCCVSGSGGTSGSGTIVGTNGTYGLGGNVGSGGTSANPNHVKISGCLVCTPPNISIAPPAPACMGDSVNITAVVTGGIGPYNYSWAPGGYTTPSIRVSPSATTTYTLTIRDSVYCRATATVQLVMNALPNINVSGYTTICNGQDNVITASGTPTYLWQPGNMTTSSVTVTPTISTTYTITGTNANGCIDIDTFPVVVNNCPDLAQFCIAINNGYAEESNAVAEFNNGSYLLAGSTDFGNSTTDIMFNRVTENGYVQWSRRYSTTSVSENIYGMTKTSDGGFAATGVANNKLLLMKLDSTGTLQWSKNVGISFYPSSGYDVKQTSDGGYVVVGTTQDGGTFGDDQVYVVKFTSAGALQWTRVYGNPGGNERGYCIVQTSDGGYAVGGEVGGYISGWQNYYIFKLNSSGVVQWNTIFGTTSDDQAEGIVELANGDLAIAGYSTILNGPLLARLSSTGTVLSAQEILGLSTNRATRFFPTSGGTFTMMTANGVLVKFDASLNILWSKHTGGFNCAVASNGGYLVTGTHLYTDFWISKTDPNGNSCCSSTPALTFSPVTWILGSGGTSTTGGTISTPTFTLTSSYGTLTQACAVPLAAPSVNLGPDSVVCGSMVLNSGTLADTYLWSTGQTSSSITVTTSGTYWVQATNSIGSDTDTIVVTVNPVPIVSTSGNASICAGDTAVISATSAGSSFVWIPGASLNNPTVSTVHAFPSATTTYTVTATSNGCSATATVQITVNSLPVAYAGIDQAVCIGSPAIIGSASSGTCSWSPATGLNSTTLCQPTATPNTNTTYVLTVTSTAGCTRRDTVSVFLYSLPTAVAGIDDTICPGGQTTLNGSGGVNCSWFPGAGLSATNICSPVATPTTTTNYILTATDANGCTDRDTVAVVVTSPPALSACCSQSLCLGDTVQLTATSPFSPITWTPSVSLSSPTGSTVQAFPSVTTNYSVTVTDPSGCTQTNTILVTVNSLPIANAGSDINLCTGSSVMLNGTGGASCSWAPATALNNSVSCQPIASPASNITYTLTVTSSAGCSASDSINITVLPVPTALAGPDQGTCPGIPVTLNGGGAQTCSWSPVTTLGNPLSCSTTATPLVTTNYTLTVTDINGCTGTDSITVTVTPGPIAVAGSDQSICPGGSVTLNGSGGSSCYWSPSAGLSSTTVYSPVASPVTTTDYVLTVNDAFGCQGYDTVRVNVYPAAPLSACCTQSLCFGDTLPLSINATLNNIIWSPSGSLQPNTGSSVNAFPNTTTSYTITATDANGCNFSDTLLITVHPGSIITACCNQVICPGDTTSLSASPAYANITWIPSASLFPNSGTNVNAFPTSTTTYTVSASDGNGCPVSDTLTLSVYPSPAIPVITQNGADLVSSVLSGNQWYLNGSPVPGATNQVYMPTQNGLYTVECTDTNGCTAQSSPYNYISTGQEQLFIGKPTCIYNPLNHSLTFNNLQEGENTLMIFDASGRLVTQQQLIVTGPQIEIPFNSATGIYIVRVNDVVEKISVQD
ncbi:MAG: T9SS type A sorting domain-containing protein [Bacteroidia bacterium]|nr:T9SS type A sorting domain-containing protein [Bacteroidia bacterium]